MLTSADADLMRVLADPSDSDRDPPRPGDALHHALDRGDGRQQTNLSNHLKVLRESGIVETEPCGRFVYYRLRPEALAALAGRFADFAATARTTAENDTKRSCP